VSFGVALCRGQEVSYYKRVMQLEGKNSLTIPRISCVDFMRRKKPGMVNRALFIWHYHAFFFGAAFFCAELFFLVGLFFFGSADFFDITIKFKVSV
jgi:hypothetical protein